MWSLGIKYSKEKQIKNLVFPTNRPTILANLPSTSSQCSQIPDLPTINLIIGREPCFKIDHGMWNWIVVNFVNFSFIQVWATERKIEYVIQVLSTNYWGGIIHFQLFRILHNKNPKVFLNIFSYMMCITYVLQCMSLGPKGYGWL